jgi:hypothetical protein
MRRVVNRKDTHASHKNNNCQSLKIQVLQELKCKLSNTHLLLESHFFIITAQHVKTTLITLYVNVQNFIPDIKNVWTHKNRE